MHSQIVEEKADQLRGATHKDSSLVGYSLAENRCPIEPFSDGLCNAEQATSEVQDCRMSHRGLQQLCLTGQRLMHVPFHSSVQAVPPIALLCKWQPARISYLILYGISYVISYVTF